MSQGSACNGLGLGLLDNLDESSQSELAWCRYSEQRNLGMGGLGYAKRVKLTAQCLIAWSRNISQEVIGLEPELNIL